MVLADPAETHADGHCPGEASEASRPPTEPGGSPSLAAFPRDSQGSAPSVDYSPSQCSCSSFSSYDDYSEDFVSESSETAVSRKHLEAPVIKGKKEKKNYVSKVLKPKGQKEISAEKKHNWNSITNVTTQRRDSETHHILSAKLHKIKELKNEITDIHRKLEATAVENQYLKQLQVRHLKAIGKYETSQNNMPQIMVKHQNEVKNLRQLLRKSKEKERTVSRKLREMNGELLKTKDALQALQILAEDKSLLEREELTQRLASLTTKMEANDQKIQSLEQQLRLNTKAFRRQMAVENQKQLAAQKAKETLQMEIKDLQQKLKEKKRELEIKNIYANRILKNLHDKDDYPKVSSTKSVQDVRTSVSFTSMRHQETQIPEDIPSLMAKVKKTTGNADHKEKPTEIVRVIPHYINKLPSQEDSNRKYEDLSKEEEHFKVQVALENVGRQREKKAAQEKKTTLEKEPAPPPPARIPAVHPEGEGQRADPREDQQEDPGEDPAAKEAGKKALQISDLDEALNKTAAPNTKLLLRPRKHYSFTEATENLHQGLPAAGGPAHLGAGRGRPAAGRRGAAGARKPEPPAGADQPPFGRPPGPKAKDAAFREKKSSLMKELFGSGSVFTDAQAGAAGAAGAGSAESWSAERPPPGQPPARSAFGDSSAAPVRSL